MTYANIILIVAVCTLNLLSFVIGAAVGQKTKRGESIKLPSPTKAVSDYYTAKDEREEQKKLNTMMANIDAYDGTPLGQREIGR